MKTAKQTVGLICLAIPASSIVPMPRRSEEPMVGMRLLVRRPSR